MKDHLRITELFPGDATLAQRVYKLEWEDETNLGDADFNDLVVILRIGADSDNDGLFDDWERFGIDANNDGDYTDPGEQDLPNGIDQNGDGDTTDPGERADPNHKDIFLEIDWMDCAPAGDCSAGDTHNHRPPAAAITSLVQAFATAPAAAMANPDGQPGINLHIDVSNAFTHQNVLNFNGGLIGCETTTAGTGRGDFDTVKAANFNNASARRFAFHYALFIHVESEAALTDPNKRYSGCGEMLGNDFYVSFGGWGAVTNLQVAGTIMHELGHNLNLRHGGNDNANYKPNYLSEMNYWFQLTGILPANRLDYSRQALANLTENSLNETLGIQDGTDSTRYFCPSPTFTQQTVAGTGAIDWNCNGTSNQTGLSANINADSVLSTLTGFDDWTMVAQSLRFQDDSDFEDGQHPTQSDVRELDLQTAETANLLFSPPDLVSPGDRTAQYSDPVGYPLTASNSDSLCAQWTFSASGLPAGLAVINNGNCTATVSGAVVDPAGTYPVVYSVTDPDGDSATATAFFIVTREGALVAPSSANPTAVKVNAPGGTTGPFILTAAVTEVTDGSSGNISNGVPVTYTLTPVGGGSPFPCTATVSGGGVGGALQTSCSFLAVPVDLYNVHIAVGGNYYQGSADSVLAVYDPSLGFVTGGGFVMRNGVAANFGFIVRYLKRGRVQGSLLYIEHRPGGDVIVKSNAMGSLSIVGGRTAYILGKATLNGVGNYSFRTTVVDNGEPGSADSFGLQVKDPGGVLVADLTFTTMTLAGGNIQVPH